MPEVVRDTGLSRSATARVEDDTPARCRFRAAPNDYLTSQSSHGYTVVKWKEEQPMYADTTLDDILQTDGAKTTIVIDPPRAEAPASESRPRLRVLARPKSTATENEPRPAADAVLSPDSRPEPMTQRRVLGLAAP